MRLVMMPYEGILFVTNEKLRYMAQNMYILLLIDNR